MLSRRSLITLLLSALVLVGPAFGQTGRNTPIPPKSSGPNYPLPHAHVTVTILDRVSPADRKLLTQVWLLSVRQKLLMSWRPLLPDAARRPMGQSGSAVCTVQLGAHGVVQRVRVVHAAGDPALLRSAEGALKSASPYPAFPPGVQARQLRLRVKFQYD